MNTIEMCTSLKGKYFSLGRFVAFDSCGSLNSFAALGSIYPLDASGKIILNDRNVPL
jgi:hypothetical protein